MTATKLVSALAGLALLTACAARPNVARVEAPVTAPPTTVPPTTVPPTTAPSTTAPSTIVPPTTVPSTIVPPTTAPPTTAPPTSTPSRRGASVPPEGVLPPMPPSGVRGMDPDDPTSVWAAQEVLGAYAQELQAAAGVPQVAPESSLVPGWCGDGIDIEHNGVILWWKGARPAGVDAVLAHAKANGVTPEVYETRYDRLTAQLTVDELIKHMGDGSSISTIAIANDCSAITVGLKKPSPAVEAVIRAYVPRTRVPLRFEHMEVSW